MSAAATCAARNNATVKTRTLGQNLKPQTPKTLKLSLSQSLLENTLCPRISLREVKPKQSNPASHPPAIRIRFLVPQRQDEGRRRGPTQ